MTADRAGERLRIRVSGQMFLTVTDFHYLTLLNDRLRLNGKRTELTA